MRHKPSRAQNEAGLWRAHGTAMRSLSTRACDPEQWHAPVTPTADGASNDWRLGDGPKLWRKALLEA